MNSPSKEALLFNFNVWDRLTNNLYKAKIRGKDVDYYTNQIGAAFEEAKNSNKIDDKMLKRYKVILNAKKLPWWSVEMDDEFASQAKRFSTKL